MRQKILDLSGEVSERQPFRNKSPPCASVVSIVLTVESAAVPPTPDLLIETLQALRVGYLARRSHPAARRSDHQPAARGGIAASSPRELRDGERTAPLVVSRIGQFPAATISFNLAHGSSLGDAVKAIEAAQRDIGLVPAEKFMQLRGLASAGAQMHVGYPD